jgi:hypothetical protein
MDKIQFNQLDEISQDKIKKYDFINPDFYDFYISEDNILVLDKINKNYDLYDKFEPNIKNTVLIINRKISDNLLSYLESETTVITNSFIMCQTLNLTKKCLIEESYIIGGDVWLSDCTITNSNIGSITNTLGDITLQQCDIENSNLSTRNRMFIEKSKFKNSTLKNGLDFSNSNILLNISDSIIENTFLYNYYAKNKRLNLKITKCNLMFSELYHTQDNNYDNITLNDNKTLNTHIIETEFETEIQKIINFIKITRNKDIISDYTEKGYTEDDIFKLSNEIIGGIEEVKTEVMCFLNSDIIIITNNNDYTHKRVHTYKFDEKIKTSLNIPTLTFVFKQNSIQISYSQYVKANDTSIINRKVIFADDLYMYNNNGDILQFKKSINSTNYNSKDVSNMFNANNVIVNCKLLIIDKNIYLFQTPANKKYNGVLLCNLTEKISTETILIDGGNFSTSDLTLIQTDIKSYFMKENLNIIQPIEFGKLNKTNDEIKSDKRILLFKNQNIYVIDYEFYETYKYNLASDDIVSTDNITWDDIYSDYIHKIGEYNSKIGLESKIVKGLTFSNSYNFVIFKEFILINFFPIKFNNITIIGIDEFYK